MQDGEKRLRAYRIRSINDTPSLSGLSNISIKKGDEEYINR